MALTDQDLTDLEIADSVGDFGRNSKVSDAVEELRALRARPVDSMRLPKHLCLYLQHNPHRGDYTPIETWIENYLGAAEANGTPRDETILPEDLAAIRATGEVWELSWCPDTPVGSCTAVAATLERALELAGDSGEVDPAPVSTDRDRTTPSPRAQHDPGAHIVMREAVEALREQRDAHGDKADPYDKLTLVARNLRDAYEWLWPLLWRDPEFVPFAERKPRP